MSRIWSAQQIMLIKRLPEKSDLRDSGTVRQSEATELHLIRPGQRHNKLLAAGISVHAAWDAPFAVRNSERSMVLDEETVLIANAGQTISTRFANGASGVALSIFLEPGVVLRSLGTLRDAGRSRLAEMRTENGELRLFEHLRFREQTIRNVLRCIADHIEQGVTDLAWFRDQVQFLIERILRRELEIIDAIAALPGALARTRQLMFRRACLVSDLIHCSYPRTLTMADFARASGASPYHTHRLFKRVHGVTPFEYLQRRRTQAAIRLAQSTQLSIDEIVERVGFSDRATLYRRARRECGHGLSLLRSRTPGAVHEGDALPFPA